MRLAGKTAIVTGAARGIGKAIAEGFAREGASVVVTDILGELAEATAAEIMQSGGSAFAVTADLADLGTHEDLITAACDRFGRLNILVNNAAVEPRAPFLEATVEEWERTVNVNLRAPYFLSQRAARAMLTTGGGRIINVASIHDERPLRTISIYTITKGGLRMLTRSLALELAEHNINVNAVAPGAILTDLNRGVLEDAAYRAKVEAKIPKGRIGATADVVGAAVFLASSEADYVTGATLYVDGGLLLQ
jgi:glucose 1-dehydrogenase